MLKTIDRYILNDLLKVFIISVLSLTMLLFLDKFLFLAEMIVSRGVSFLEVLRIMTYISPAFLALTIPMSVLFASVVVFNQFSAHNEWVAMRASNMSFMRLMRSVLLFSFCAYMLTNAVMFYALPWGNLAYKQIIYDIIRNRAALDIKPRVFNEDFDNLILYTLERDADSTLRNVFIADSTRSVTPKIITAQEGLIVPNPKTFKIQLQLNQGTIHELSESKDDYQTLNFDRYDLTLSLPDTERLEQDALVGHREMSLKQIIKKIETMKQEGLDPSGPQVELSKKFSIPFICLLFGLLGAPLGIHSSRSGKSGSFAMSVSVILLYYIGLVSTQNLGRVGTINPYISVWIPNIVVLAAVSYLTYKMQKEKPFKIFDWMAYMVMRAVHFGKRLFGRLAPASSKLPAGLPPISRRQKAIEKTAKEIFDRKMKDLKSP